MKRDRSFPLIALCFLLSGFAALIYQTAWTRQFAFVFGTSELAVATVLAAYMAGLAGGAAVGGRLATRVRQPLFAYALLELGIGVAALCVPALMRGADRLFITSFGQRAELGQTDQLAISAFYLATTFAIVMVPTLLMGATLPLLARHAVRSDREVGPRIGLLYAINTFGAVGGTLVTAFVLLGRLGIRDTVYVAVGVNFAVFLAAALLVRVAPLASRGATPAGEAARGDAAPGRFILPLILVSGAISFGYEVLWTRLLAHVLGGSVYAFATMLASFLLGIAIGSAVASRLATGRARATRWFATAQLGAGLASAAAFASIDYVPGLAQPLSNPQYRLWLDAAIAIAVLLPAALCIGATYPLAVRVLARSAEDAGPASARVYTWNTLGSIVGSVGAAFLLLPALGFSGTLLVAALVNLGLAFATLAFGGQRGPLLFAPAAAAALLLVFAPGEPWRLLRTTPWAMISAPGPMRFFEVGRSATVMLTQPSPTGWRLRSNGLPESLIRSKWAPPARVSPGTLLGALGPLLRPDARSMMVVGLGGSSSLEFVPRTIDRIEVIELEPEVLAANELLGPDRQRNPLADERVRVHLNDARGALHLSLERFDVVAAQPSHPWTAGASHLYTREFFELVADHLSDQGVFVQWLGSSFGDTELLRSIVATFLEVFDYVHVYRGVLFVGSNRPIPVSIDLQELRSRDPLVQATTGVHSKEQLAVELLLDDAGARAFAAGAPPNTDDRNFLQMRSQAVGRLNDRARRQNQNQLRAAMLEHDPLPRLVAEGTVDGPRTVEAMLQTRGTPQRARALAATLANERDRAFARALIELRADNEPAKLARYLQQHPDDLDARAALLLRRRTFVAAGHEFPYLADVEAPADEALVVEGWRLARRGDFETLAGLDAQLATVDPNGPWHLAARELRVRWRVALGGSENTARAVELTAELYTRGVPAALLLRAQAAAAHGDMRTALGALSRLARDEDDGNLRGRARALLDSFGVDESLRPWRNRLRLELAGARPARDRTPD